MKNKGQLDAIQGGVLTLLILAITLGIGFVILQQIGQVDQGTASAFDSNNTFVAINSSNVSFNNWDQSSCTGVNISAQNNTADVTSFFTISGCNAYLTTISINNTRVTANFTYVYTTHGYANNVTGQISDSLSQIPGWIPVILVALIGGLVLFLVMRSMTDSK